MSAKNFFLTYPQAIRIPNKEFLSDFLRSLTPPRASYDITFIRVSRELHEDGQQHFHAVWSISKAYKPNPRFFDCEGHHPNIQRARGINAVMDYVAKEGDFIDFGEKPSRLSKHTWQDTIEAASSKEDFLQLAVEHHTRDAVLSYERLEYFADKRFKKESIPYEPTFTAFQVPTELDIWWADNMVKPFQLGFRPQSLCLVSPSRYGKTEWARSLGVHVYFNNLFDLNEFNDTATYAVFDDFDWESIRKFAKPWFGAQKVFTATDKYRKKTQISWGKPSILLCNPDQQPIGNDNFMNWWDSNVLTVTLNRAFF